MNCSRSIVLTQGGANGDVVAAGCVVRERKITQGNIAISARPNSNGLGVNPTRSQT